MIIKNLFFVKSVVDINQRPLPYLGEIFLTGRSNVGKSSFIRSLANNKKIVFTSKVPGKTVTLNYFSLNNSFYLVDSPGYGYTKRNKNIKKTILPMINDYLHQKIAPKIVLQLIDFKVGPTRIDLCMYKRITKHDFLTVIILNKKDKISRNQIAQRFQHIQKIFQSFNPTVNIPIFLLSCKTKEGFEDVKNFFQNYIDYLI
ncbi:MAG: ribosome biogenesis GTP-binding protein YihA/YsxC [Vigna little leaf phytoplasma]|nr:ribosome biogenesis GTP-binding protein YihA/YsxC [Vigna little leaf phytoplasma]